MQFLGNCSFMAEKLLSSSESKETNLYLPNKIQSKAKQRYPCAGLLQAKWFQEVEVLRFLDNQHMKW